MLCPPPGLSSLKMGTVLVADCIDLDWEVVWQVRQEEEEAKNGVAGSW